MIRSSAAVVRAVETWLMKAKRSPLKTKKIPRYDQKLKNKVAAIMAAKPDPFHHRRYDGMTYTRKIVDIKKIPG